MTQGDSGLLLRCAGCGRARPRGWFARAGAGRRASWCRECRLPQRLADAARRRGAGVAKLAPGLVRRLWASQRGLCGLCGLVLVWGRVHVDHIVPVARGGQHVEANLQLAHPACNLAKGAGPARKPRLTPRSKG